MSQIEDENELIAEALEFLMERKKTSSCLACGEIISSGSILICSECLGEEMDKYIQAIENIENNE
jgi:hypothetical protein